MMSRAKINEIALQTISEWLDNPMEYSDQELDNIRLMTLGIIKGVQIMADELKRELEGEKMRDVVELNNNSTELNSENVEYISRQDAINRFSPEDLPTAEPISDSDAWFRIGETLADISKDSFAAEQGIAKIQKYLRQMESPERKVGKWVPVDSFSAFGGDEATWMAHGNPVAFYYCSACREQTLRGEDGESILSDYCPNCGAKMEGEQDD